MTADRSTLLPGGSHSIPLGIDLGTTFSCVAQIDKNGNPRTIANLDGDLLTPSVIFFDRNAMVVGKEALKAAMVKPEMIARWVKREMGKPLFWKSFDGEFYPPEVLQSVILEKLATDACHKVGPIKDAVITVPAYFSEPKRKATMDAGRLAGLNVLDIINEPTAAAIAFGVERGFLDPQATSKLGETILVYDLGGGTFDVSIVRVEANRFRVIATDGDFKLGGIDWDQKIADLIADAFYNEHLTDLTTNAKSEQQLLREAEEAKRSLSTRTELSIYFEHAGESVAVPLSRDDLNRMTAHLVERTRFTTLKVLRDAGLKWNHLTRILLVGGSTRMPAIVEMLEDESGMRVDRSLAADEAVAHGAAIYASLIARSDAEGPHVQISNVNSHDLGVLGLEKATGMHRTKVLLPRNSVLPAKHGAAFTTAEEGQRNVVVNVVEGGDASGNHATPIGKCVIRGLPPGLAAGTQVNVIFEYQNNGRLKIRASIPSIGQNAETEIQREAAASDAKLEQWSQKIRSRTRPSDINLSDSRETNTDGLDGGQYNDVFDLDDFLK